MRCHCCDAQITRYLKNKHTGEIDDLCSKCRKIALEAAEDTYKVPEDCGGLVRLTQALERGD